MKMKWMVVLLTIVVILWLSPAHSTGVESFVVERFNSGDQDKFPSGWEGRNDKETRKAHKIYRVVVEEGNAYLLAHSKGDAVQIGKKVEVDLKKFPFLTWKWRVDKICQGGDERHKETGDSPAAIYVVFPTWKMWKPKAIKYVWSASELEIGFETQSPYSSDTKIIVLRNRHSPIGQWVSERRNVLEDYRKFWGRKLKKVKLIGIMTDSDNTKKEAIAAYDDLVMTTDN